MLTNEQLEKLMNDLGLTPEARAVVANIRGSDPSRRTQSSPKSVNSRYASRKMGQVIQAESRSLELTAVTLWEHDDDVYEYYDQPPQLRLNTKTKLGQVTGYGYTPDFFVLAKDFIGWVECKKTEFLEAEVANGKNTFIFEKNQWLHVPGSQYAKSLGLQFEVFTECSFSSAQLNNTVFLEDYWRVGCAAIGLVEQKKIRKLFDGAPFLTLGNLIGRGGDGTADIIYKMLADEQLHFLAEEEHLSEHSSTKIFLEIAEAKAYSFRKKIALTQDAEIYQSPVITLAVGSRLKWKNKIYEIVEAGDDNRCLKGPDDRAIFLPIDDLERLIAIGDIKSGEPEETARAEAAAICNSAHPKEIEDALERLQCLKDPERIFSVTGKKPCPRIRRTWEARARKSKELYGCVSNGSESTSHSRFSDTTQWRLNAPAYGEMDQHHSKDIVVPI